MAEHNADYERQRRVIEALEADPEFQKDVASSLHFMTDASGRLWEWDKAAVARYVYIHGTRDDCPVVRTEDVGKGVHIDYDAQGRVLGIEFI